MPRFLEPGDHVQEAPDMKAASVDALGCKIQLAAQTLELPFCYSPARYQAEQIVLNIRDFVSWELERHCNSIQYDAKKSQGLYWALNFIVIYPEA